jgi:hypothetical protein
MFSPLSFEKLILITGHYGTGKTNIALNFALDLRGAGHAVTLIDLDVVNPYFRSSDYRDFLQDAGITVIAPTFAGTTLDNPVLSPAIAGALDTESKTDASTKDFGDRGYLIMDVGGDDVGATALGMFASRIENRDHDFLYVVNKNRNLTQTPAEALEILSEIERVTRLKATGIINNTHLQSETTCETVEAGEAFGRDCAQQSGLPLMCVSVPENQACSNLTTPKDQQYATRIYVKPPW